MSEIVRYRCTDRCQASHRHAHEWATVTTDDVPKDAGAEYEWMTADTPNALLARLRVVDSPRKQEPLIGTDLASWFEAQIAEDERQVAEIRESDYGDRTLIEEPWASDGIYAPDISDFGGLWISPARVLAECEAKRAIVDRWQREHDDQHTLQDVGIVIGLREAIRYLALPYSDRPGYQEDWKP